MLLRFRSIVGRTLLSVALVGLALAPSAQAQTIVGQIAGWNAESVAFGEDLIAVVAEAVAEDDRLGHHPLRAKPIRHRQEIGRAFRSQAVRHSHAVCAKRRFAQRGELVDHGIRCQTVHGAEQVITIERVGDHRFRAERSHAIGTGRIANQANDAVPSGDKKTGQRDPEGAAGTGDKHSHDLLRPASRTTA